MTKPTPEWLEKWLPKVRDEMAIAYWREVLTAIHAEVYEEASTVECHGCKGERLILRHYTTDGELGTEACHVCDATGRITREAKARRETLEEVRGKIRLCEETSPHDDVRFINGVKTWLAEQLKEMK